MSIASVTQTLALQREQVRPDLVRLIPFDSSLWSQIKTRADITTVSNRPTRVPQYLLSGGKHSFKNYDGGDLGQGSSFVTDFWTLVPVYPSAAWQYTKLTEIATNSDKKAIEDYGMRTMKEAMAEFNVFMEALLNTDGSNTLGTVTAVSGTTLTVSNGNQFRDGNDYDVWSALSGVFRGTITPSSVDNNNDQLFCPSVPAGTIANDLLLVSGSSGVAGTGFLGLLYYQVSGNTGNIGGLARSAYPGKLSTPTVNFGAAALTPAKARLMLANMQKAMGVKQPNDVELLWNMNLDMVAAWENAGLVITSLLQSPGQAKAYDPLPKAPPKTLAGRPIVGDGMGSIHATPARIDGVPMKHLFRVENQPIDFYEVAGQTTFPAYGASGGLAASTIFYLWTGCNLGNDSVRSGTFGTNIATPSGYFGK